MFSLHLDIDWAVAGQRSSPRHRQILAARRPRITGQIAQAPPLRRSSRRAAGQVVTPG
jgi:hypothetical protein